MTIREIAQLAGVSSAAVSRYLNGGYVSGEKKERIKKVIQETGYQPSMQARTLRTKKACLVGVVVPKINSESISRVTEGVGQVLSERGYHMLLASTDNQADKEVMYMKIFENYPVDGIILIGTMITAQHRKFLKESRVPVVVIGQYTRLANCVYHDDYGAARAVTGLLLRRGSKRQVYIGVTARDHAAGYARHQGYLDALKAAGRPPRAEDMFLAQFTMESGYWQARAMLDAGRRPDGIFCATDTIAVGAMQACREAGLTVGRDVLVAGIGDSAIGRGAAVPLTSAHLHYKTSGQEAAQLLLNLMRRQGAGTRAIQLGFEVVERQSTAAALGAQPGPEI